MRTKSQEINFWKTINIAESFGIKVILIKDIELDEQIKKEMKITTNMAPIGQWNGGKTIYIHIDKATAYEVLHEMGHVFNGYMCCREHAEYAAHGSAITLSKIFRIRLPNHSKYKANVYAGCSARKACGAIKRK